MIKNIVFIDSEIGIEDKKIHDLGAVKYNSLPFHSPSVKEFEIYISNSDYICGHNIIRHDLKYILPIMKNPLHAEIIDTLYISPLLFPKRPYHALLKDDKLQTEELNNPLNDAEKAQKLFHDEENAFYSLSPQLKQIYYGLLGKQEQFKGFFSYVNFRPFFFNTVKLIKKEFFGKICENVDLDFLIEQYPVELAYTLALINTDDYHSITPPWLLRNYPKIENITKLLCGTPCKDGCEYCRQSLNIFKSLHDFFGYDSFRTYNGEPLQQNAAQAAVDGKALLAVFPTGGGKSITFQLPALMAGKNIHGLTVVISPLQSLMKDQVDNLSERGLVDAVTVNGLLSPIERAEALERVANGLATILYISPEQLRSRTIEKLLLSRNIVRFVIDEAHCFSAWGQDFRVDYLYIGDFIKQLQKKKQLDTPIPVSCFTATAKQKVISDICDYFYNKLSIELELFASSATRENLHYAVFYKETDEEKYNTLRSLIETRKCPTIIYVSRTRRCRELADKLTSDGFSARPYYGKMESKEKIANQEAFKRNEVNVMVATSAFGMGVDKSDVKLVIHYDISDSLENYVQEAGRAGRDPSLQAECFVLFNDNDLNKHFMLLNQTKLNINEIQQVWKAIKDLTKFRATVCCSPLEIARQAGWDDSGRDMETRVKTAIAALEDSGYVKRGQNMPHVYASGILVKNMAEASSRIERSKLFEGSQKMNAKRIIQSLISQRSISKVDDMDAESRVDYLADTLGIEKEEIIALINLMRIDGLLADTMDMSAYILKNDTQHRSSNILEQFLKLEKFILSQMDEDGIALTLKELNEAALAEGISNSSVKKIRTILYYLTIKSYIFKPEKPTDIDEESTLRTHTKIFPAMEQKMLLEKFYRRAELCRFILNQLYSQILPDDTRDEILVQFSLVGLFEQYSNEPSMDIDSSQITINDFEDSLLYLSKIGAMKLEGGFLVLYNGMEIKRLIVDNKIRYKLEDYKTLSEFYEQKMQQIHIVGEYANMMVRDYNAALKFVDDYFHMEFKKFISTYFKGERANEIKRNITPAKFDELFGGLSETQAKIINDSNSRVIVVAAGPGSGKTRVLVHKLAALYLMEDVKHEQLLMVTFSRAAATEFKKRLMTLIGNAANFIEIKTFHSYCFDLLGKIGSLEGVENVVKDAAAMIAGNEVEPGRIAKTVLVIDEAQDMDKDEFSLVLSLMANNDDMRVIAVGDDDQNIYEFRGSDSEHLRTLITDYNAVKYEMTENYRSCSNIVALSNDFADKISNRMKSIPIQAVQNKNGTVQIIHHVSTHLEQPIVENLINTHNSGKACILTQTNDEALQVLGLLTRRGISAKLIQSMDGFKLYNLAEMRFFLKLIDRTLSSPTISDENWQYAKAQLCKIYSNSSCLDVCLKLLDDFEQVNSYSKYRTDLEEFIKESQYEDFCTDDGQSIYVSTIHKSKGREFDDVYILLDRASIKTDAEKRKLYVAITRAKNKLYIHCNTGIFDYCHLPEIEHITDSNIYPEPNEISLQLTHRDVVLDYFKSKKQTILKLHSGTPLEYDDGYLTADITTNSIRVVKLSKACMEKLTHLAEMGYTPIRAEVRFVVAWIGENDTEETAVLLPNIYLSKNK